MEPNELIERFAEEHGLSRAESSELLNEFDLDVDATSRELQSRYRPAAAEWGALRKRFGFQSPFPVRLALPRGNRVYHQLKSLTLTQVGNLITLRCSTQYIGKPGTHADGARASLSHSFEFLPYVRTLTDVFEHWAPSQRVFHSERLLNDPMMPANLDEQFFWNPELWTLQDFVDYRSAQLQKAGSGTYVRLSLGCLGYLGSGSTVYLFSADGRDGAIVTENKWPCIDFPIDEFQISQFEGIDKLPVLSETPFEFVKSG